MTQPIKETGITKEGNKSRQSFVNETNYELTKDRTGRGMTVSRPFNYICIPMIGYTNRGMTIKIPFNPP